MSHFSGGKGRRELRSAVVLRTGGDRDRERDRVNESWGGPKRGQRGRWDSERRAGGQRDEDSDERNRTEKPPTWAGAGGGAGWRGGRASRLGCGVGAGGSAGEAAGEVGGPGARGRGGEGCKEKQRKGRHVGGPGAVRRGGGVEKVPGARGHPARCGPTEPSAVVSPGLTGEGGGGGAGAARGAAWTESGPRAARRGRAGRGSAGR